MPGSRGRDALGQELSEKINREVRRRLLGLPDLPQGVVTIVFTDVEGSTEMVLTLGDEAARGVLRRHDDILREAVDRHEGIEVERVGDGFMVAFRLPSKALAFAMDLRQRLADEPWEHDGRPVRVRIGVDTGEVIAEEKGYFGATVFRAARIAELAAGNQILVSEATRALASSAPAAFRDAGEHELKGFSGSHRLFEVQAVDPELPQGGAPG